MTVTSPPTSPDRRATSSTNPPVTAASVTRRHVLDAVRTALDSVGAAPWSGQQVDHLVGLLREALVVSERGDDGTAGRAAPAIRAACAHLAAHQREDAYLALLCAQERFGEF